LLKSTLNSRALRQSTQGILKPVSSTHYYTNFIQLTSNLAWLRQTMILPLLPKNRNTPSSLFIPGYVIGELKLMRLSQSMWHSLQDETRTHRNI
jgi:hypothetical protein